MSEPNNTLGTATNIGTIGFTPTSIFDFVGSTDTQDFWRFNLTTTSDINIGLTGLSADAEVRLLNFSGTVIASSTRSGTLSEDINLNNLTAGTYFVRVYQFSGNTSYNLRLSNASVSNILAPQETLGALSSTPITRTGSINNNNTSDIYRFSLSSTSDINIGLTGLTADLNLRFVQDVNNNGIVDGADVTFSSVHNGTSSEEINLNSRLAAGNYFAQVYQVGSNSSGYTLRLSNADPSNILVPQQILGALSTTPITRTGSINNNNTSDIYRFSLSSTRDINIGLTGLTADLDLRFVRDVDNDGIVDAGDVIVSSNRTGTNSEDINLNSQLAAGNYFAQVRQFGSNSSGYTLRLSNTNISDLLAPQENFGTLVGSRTRSDSIGNTDTSDFYRFSVFGTRRLSATLSGLSADVDLRLVRDGNGDGIVQSTEVVGSSTRSGTLSESLNLILGSGDYYLQAYQFSGNTNYNLGVTVT